MITEKAKERREALVHDLVEAMKQGTAPWQQPWVAMERPFNAVTGRHYNGANMLNLALRSSALGAGNDPRWCTFEQAKEKGWSIKKGSKGTAVEFYKFEEKPKMDEFGAPVLNEKGEQEVEKSVLVRNYVVFHASQINGIGPYAPKVRNPVENNEKAERILAESGADIRHGGDVAGYNIEGDYIRLPQQEAFNTQADYYATALHELTHWTGHRDRLNRPLSYDMDSEKYAREELVAEISSMFVSAETGIPQTKEHFQNHAAYVDHWIGHLEQDPNALFKAVRDAQRASEEILKHERLREQSQTQEAQQTQNASGSLVAQKTWPGSARISGGEAIPVSVLTEQAIQALKLINGNEKVTIGQEANGQSYKGEVLHVDQEQGLCVQKIGRESLYVHKLDKLAEVPKVGDNVKIAYSKNPEEKASITLQETRHKGLRR